MTQWIIQEVSFEDVLPVWQFQLWPGRKSPIESVSAIDEYGNINAEIMNATPHFLGCYQSAGTLIGVVSGYSTSKKSFRSRGLWVDQNHRHHGLGSTLINHLQKRALQLNHHYIWTMARHSSLSFYQKIGFVSTRELHQYEFGPHFICTKNL
jgi:GNAT superfamily N-acetyltransferase